MPLKGTEIRTWLPKPQAATLVVAAVDSLFPERADYHCDGVADNVEIQAALDALPAGGGTVQLLEGKFRLGALGISKTGVDKITIKGCGDATEITIEDTSGIAYILDFNNCNDLVLTDFSVNCYESPAGLLSGIFIDGCNRVLLENLTIFYTTVAVAVAGNGILVNAPTQDFKIKNCTIRNSHGYSVLIDTTTAALITDVLIEGCIIDGAFYNGFAIYGVDYFTVTGNDIRGTNHSGIACSPARHGTIASNIVRGVHEAGTESGIEVENGHVTTGEQATYDITVSGNEVSDCDIGINVREVGGRGYPYGITINGNSIYDCTQGIELRWVNAVTVIGNSLISNTSIGIKPRQCQYVNVKGNIISSGGGGIYLEAADYIKVSDNVIWGTDLEGIQCDAFSDYLEILDNVVINSGTVGSPKAGILAWGDNSRFIGNYVTDTRAGGARESNYGLYLLGDNNIVENNKFLNNINQNFRNSGSNNRFSKQYSEMFMDVLAVLATHIRSNEDLSAAVPITFTIDAQPDVPRTLSGSFDSFVNITAYTIVFTGIDAKGEPISEEKTEADGWDWETSNAFATITSIIMTARTGTGVGDTIDIGITDVLGLSNLIYATGDVYKIKKNNANAVAAGAQVNTTYDTYDMAIIGLGAGDDFTIWYRHNLNMVG